MLVRALGAPELAGVFCRPVPDVVPEVVELDNRGVLGLDVGRAEARADSSARGSSSALVVSVVALSGDFVTRLVDEAASGPADEISSRSANKSS